MTDKKEAITELVSLKNKSYLLPKIPGRVQLISKIRKGTIHLQKFNTSKDLNSKIIKEVRKLYKIQEQKGIQS